MNRNYKNKLLILILVLSLSILLIISLTKIHFFNLVIKTFPDEKIVFQKKISPNQVFAFVYIHSVAQTPVWEFFKIGNEGKMILFETHFYDHGAGLPYAAFGDEVFVMEDNRFKIKNMYREIQLPLYYRIYKDRGNIFIFEESEINLSDTIGDALLTIDIDQLNIINYLFDFLKFRSRGEGQ